MIKPPGESAADLRERVRGPVPEQVDVAIIGSGLGGLTAGAYLSRQGLRVACFESHYVAGGCATQFRRRGADGTYHFDIGLHYIGECGEGGVIPRVLRDVGIELEFLPLDPDGFDTLIFPDFRFAIPASIELYRQRLLELFPAERRGIDKYLRLLLAVRKLAAPAAAGKRPSLLQLLGVGRSLFDLARYQHCTIGEFLDGCTRDPRLRAVLLGQSGDYGLPPSEVSALMHLGLCGHYFASGAYYPKGGGQVIADRLAQVIEAHGGSVHLRHPVERILVEREQAVGVRLTPNKGQPAISVRAKVVLSNADLIVTLQRLLGREHLSAQWQERLPRLRMADAIFISFLGVSADMRKLGMKVTNYWQFDGYDMQAFYDVTRRSGGVMTAASGEKAVTPFDTYGCYVTCASLKDPHSALHHAPAGITNVEVMTLVPGAPARWGVDWDGATHWQYKKSEPYHELKQQLEQQMIDRLEKIFPGTTPHIVYRESATPLSQTRYTGASDGTSYGLAATPAQFLQNRPGYRGPVKGLYLCGASTRAGHGIFGAMLGGRNAARRIAAELGRPLS